MIYFDTSFLAPLILPEAATFRVAAFVERLPGDEQTVSHWTRVEFSSLIAQKVRMGDLDEEKAERADARFEEMVKNSFAVALPSVEDFDLAKRYLAMFAPGLSAPDALHLAVAMQSRGDGDLQSGQGLSEGREDSRFADDNGDQELGPRHSEAGRPWRKR